MRLAYIGCGFRQRFGAARGQRDIHAFGGKRHRAGASQALAGCAHDGAAAFDPKIHCLTPVLCQMVFRSSDFATVANIVAYDKTPGLRRQNSSVSMSAYITPEESVMPGLFDVSQEVILVTGASQGLGRQFARHMAPRSCWRRARPLN